MLGAVERPESILTYIRGAKARDLLTQIGRRELPLTHAAFDALPRSTAAEHLRALLAHHEILPARGSEPVVRFRQWLARRLTELPDDGTRGSIERYATWRHLRRIRDRERAGTANMGTVTRAAKQEITEAGKFLLWLRETHDVGVADIQQAHLDEYLSAGTTTRTHIRNYIHWLQPGRNARTRHLEVRYRTANSTPLVTQEQRLAMIRNCIEFDQVVTSTRIAGLIHLLWAQPLNRIVMLRRSDAVARVDGMWLKLGTHPVLVPQPLADTFGTYFDHPSNQQTGNTDTDWVFPGGRAGHHIHETTLGARLKILGINPQRARNATLQDLTRQLDARTLIDLLGYTGQVITLHAARSGAPMSDYVTLRRASRGSDR